MAGLRDGIEKGQFQTFPSTSVRSVAAKFDLQPPLSVLRLAKLLKPETLIWDTGWVTSGDDNRVEARGKLSLTSLGFWNFSGEVKDNGDAASFGFAMAPKFVDPSFHFMIFGESAELSEDEILPFNKKGRSMWIGRNWDNLLAQGYTWSLHASTSPGFVEILGYVFFGVGAAGAGGGTAYAISECENWVQERQPDGTKHAVCLAG
jgi:hypothetical protein